jgi:hypothetical protein
MAGSANAPKLSRFTSIRALANAESRLSDEGVFVGEVTIAGVVSGAGPESPHVPTIEGKAVADTFWRLYKTRSDVRARVG